MNDKLKQSNKEWLERTKNFALDPQTQARYDAWKRKWGYLPPEPPAREFANALNERIEQRWLVDRTAADDQLSGKAFTAKRREALEAAVGKSYLAEEYGLRTAMDMRPLSAQRGMRADNVSSSKYVRDNPEGVNALCKKLLEGTDIPAERHKDVLFVNSPSVIDKVKALYGDRLFPPSQCVNPSCALSAPSGRGAPAKKLRAQAPKTPCPGCSTELAPYPTLVEIAPGIHGLLTEFNSVGSFPEETPFHEEKAVTSLDGQKSVLTELMKSLGATPSMYQAFKAVNQGKDTLALLDEPVATDASLKKVTDAAKTKFASIAADHPMRVIADAAASLVCGLDRALSGPAPVALPDDAKQKYLLRLSRLEASLPVFADARGIESLEPQWRRLDEALGAAKAEAGDTRWEAANKQLDTAEALAGTLRTERMNRDPLLANSLAQLEKLVSAMPAMANDTPRFTKLFDLLTDEMHIILSRTRPYDDASFKQAASAQLKERAPSLANLAKDVEVTPHMVSSGMDALTTGVVSARLALGEPAQLVDESANYFETPAVLSHTSVLGADGRVIVGSLNPSTPTRPPSDVSTLIDKVTGMLGPAPPTTQFALVVDVTIEKGGDGKSTDVDLLFANPVIAKAIDDGRLSVTICKSYQKYPGLGVGKVMAGSTTTIAKKGAFPLADDFLNKVDKEQNYMGNDESQLMTHLVAQSGEQEIGLEAAAARNAGKLASMVQRRADDPIATVNKGLPFVLVPDGATPMIGPDKRPIPMAKLLPLLGVEERDSFGFQNSSYLEIPSGIRINTGQESEGALAEKFHALANVGIKAQTANTDAQEHYAKVDKPRYQRELQDWNRNKVGDKPVMPKQPKNTEFGVDAVFDSLSGELDRFKDTKETPLGPPVLAQDDSLADKIRNIGKAFKPETDMATLTSSQDPQKILGSVSYGPVAKQMGKVNNEIASYLMLAKGMTDCLGDEGRKSVKPEDLKRIKDMHEAFIEGGMQTVTPETQAQLIANWMQLSLASWPAEPEEAQSLASKVEGFARQMPYREDKAKAVLNGFSDAEFAKIPPAAQKNVLGGLFGPLDIESKLNVVSALLAKSQRQKASACLDDLERILQELKDGTYGGLSPEQLGSATSGSSPKPISPREIAAFDARIRELSDAFFAKMPAAALQATAKAEGEMAAAAEMTGPNARARPAIDGERRALRLAVEDAVVRAELVIAELASSAGTVTMPRDKREVARCIKGLQASTAALKKLIVLYAD